MNRLFYSGNKIIPIKRIPDESGQAETLKSAQDDKVTMRNSKSL
jgi:hypothetical protein